MEVFDQWKQVFSQHLGKIFWKHFAKIFLSLQTINQNLKTGFLWDIGSAIDPLVISQVVAKLKYLSLLQADVHVLCCAEECFIISTKNVLKNSKEIVNRTQSFYFVDVRECLKTPVIISPGTLIYDTIDSMVRKVVRKIETFMITTKNNDEFPVMFLSIENDWCVPTLTGILLGYPVVYWNGGSSENGGSCLGFTPLVVHRVTTELKNQTSWTPHEIYSFSVPTSILPEVSLHIEIWYNETVIYVFEKQNIFETLQMNKHTVSFPTVVL